MGVGVTVITVVVLSVPAVFEPSPEFSPKTGLSCILIIYIKVTVKMGIKTNKKIKIFLLNTFRPL